MLFSLLYSLIVIYSLKPQQKAIPGSPPQDKKWTDSVHSPPRQSLFSLHYFVKSHKCSDSQSKQIALTIRNYHRVFELVEDVLVQYNLDDLHILLTLNTLIRSKGLFDHSSWESIPLLSSSNTHIPTRWSHSWPDDASCSSPSLPQLYTAYTHSSSTE